MKLIKIEANAIQVTWPYVKEFIEKPLKVSQGEYNLFDIYYCLIHGQLDLWVGADSSKGILGVMVSQVIYYPRYKALNIMLVGTEPNTIKLWLDYSWNKETSPILKYAKENNIKRIEGWTRDGWSKHLKNYGFKKYRTVLTKEI